MRCQTSAVSFAPVFFGKDRRKCDMAHNTQKYRVPLVAIPEKRLASSKGLRDVCQFRSQDRPPAESDLSICQDK